MALTVPESRLDLTQADVASSDTLRALTWVDAVRQHNWLAGRPVSVVPSYRPGVLFFNDANDYYFRTKPRYQDTRYVLKLRLSHDGASPGTAQVTLPVGGTTYTLSARPRSSGNPIEYELPFDLASQGTTETSLSFRVEPDDAGNYDIEACSIEAAPRVFLVDDGSDLGLDRLRFNHRAPITANDLAKLLARTNELRAAARRVGMWHHAWGSGLPFSTTSGAGVNAFGTAGGNSISLLARSLYDGDTTRTLSWAVRGYCSDGTTSADVELNASTSGGNDVISIPTGTTAAAWMATSTSAFAVNVEDNTEADGLPSSAHDEVDVTVTRTAGAGTVFIESISIWEG